MNNKSNRETIYGDRFNLGRIYLESARSEAQVKLTVYSGTAKMDIFKCNRTEKNKKKLCSKGERVYIVGDSYVHPREGEDPKDKFLIYTNKGKLLRERSFLNDHIASPLEATSETFPSETSGKDVNGKRYHLIHLMNNEELKLWVLKKDQVAKEGRDENAKTEVGTSGTLAEQVNETPQCDPQSDRSPDEHLTREQEVKQLQCLARDGYAYYPSCLSVENFIKTYRGVYYTIPDQPYSHQWPCYNQWGYFGQQYYQGPQYPRC